MERNGRLLLRNLRWLKTRPSFLSGSQRAHVQSYSYSVAPTSSLSSQVQVQTQFALAPLALPLELPLEPTGTLPPLQNELEYTRRTFTVNGQTVQTYQRGHGEHAVFVAPGGLGVMRLHLLPLLEGLDKEKYSIYSWDVPGYGESAPPIRDITNDSLYEDLKILPTVLKKLGHENYSLLGWSAGAVTSLLLASYYPQLVRKVLAWGVAMEMDEKQIQLYRRYSNIDTWGHTEATQKAKAFLISIFGESFYRNHLAHWGEMFAEVGEKEGAKSFANQLGGIECPTLFVHGEADPAIHPRQHGLYRKYVKHADFISIPNAKHTPQLEMPQQFLSVVNRFLEQK